MPRIRGGRFASTSTGRAFPNVGGVRGGRFSATNTGRRWPPPVGFIFDADSLAGQMERMSGDATPANDTWTINGVEIPVEKQVLTGNQTISSNTNWGSATADQRMTVVRVDGNLTVDSGVTLSTSVRKLGLTILVTGTLTNSGTISMTARGANHSASGSNLAARAILVVKDIGADGEIPAAGANGAASRGPTTAAQAGNTGSAGTNGQTGGGGSGGVRGDSTYGITAASGTGAAGTSFSGGPGSGGCSRANTNGSSAAASSSGAVGGAGNSDLWGAGGGAGNPGGAAASGSGGPSAGATGTGGLLILIALGALTNNASAFVSSNGANGGGTTGTTSNTAGAGAGSGAGSVSVYHRGALTNNGTIQANGGAKGVASGTWSGGTPHGGDGGAGTARMVSLAA